MYVHFLGEPDDGIRPSSQLARALATLGVRSAFGDAPSWRSKRWREICRHADVIHVTAYCVRDQGLLRRLWLAKAKGVVLVRTWMGSDVLWALHHPRSMTFARRLQDLGVKQLAVADHLIDELASIGVQAEFVPIVAPQVVTGEAEIPPFPDRFTILCYLPARRRIFYGGPIVDDLMARTDSR